MNCTTSDRSESTRRWPRWPSIGVVVLLVMGGGWFCGPSGRVTGVEFSPDLFEHRSFRYYQWCGIPITPKETHVWRTDFDAYLHDAGYIDTAGIDEPRWQLVKGFAPGVRGWSGPAKHGCQAIGCFNGDDGQWITWSSDHPELAAVAWPVIVLWVRDERYDAVYLLFYRLRESPPSVEQLKQAIDELSQMEPL
ncbi:hypothetical protein NG895_15275 [Aeoliella sp. ICT_H6.2]|uniref:Uncharacterized protein n=1 Tax=Aeoliella straminimaris TaxID=2954799 RepID=A0A9X2FA81_9BACT|nr:hypothetical protein [Aeoliella straminimaris]MCO6045272.1 hypothetical protein [Aeoliella straminimaris]